METLQVKHAAAHDLTQRALPNVIQSDAKLITRFQNAIDRTNKVLQLVMTQLNNAKTEIGNLQFETNRRIWFHQKLGLDGLKYVLEEKFIKGWEIMKQEVFNYVTKKLFHFSEAIQMTLVQMMESSNSSQAMDILEQIWKDRLDVKAKTNDRATEYLNTVDDAISSATPLLESNFTHNGRYDASYLSTNLVDPEPNNRSDKINEAIRLNGRIPNQFNKLNGHLATRILDEDVYTKTQNELIARASQFDKAMKVIEDDVIYAPLKSIDDRVVKLANLNKSINMHVTEFNTKIDDLLSLILNINNSHVERLLLTSQSTSRYLHDASMRKTELAQIIGAPDVVAAVNNMEPFFYKLSASSLALKDSLTSIGRILEDVWMLFHTDSLLDDFYKELNNNFILYENLTLDTELTEMFASLLDIEPDEVRVMDKNELRFRTNADVATLTTDKINDLSFTFQGFINSTDLHHILGDLDIEFEEAIDMFVDSLNTYKWSSTIGNKFIKWALRIIGISLIRNNTLIHDYRNLYVEVINMHIIMSWLVIVIMIGAWPYYCLIALLFSHALTLVMLCYRDNFIYLDVYLDDVIVKSISQDIAYDGIGVLGELLYTFVYFHTQFLIISLIGHILVPYYV